MAQTRGFTLIEILVVIAIVGVMASVVQLSFGGINDRQQLAATAEAAAHRIELARANALQRNREWGLRVDESHYGFVEFDEETGRWLPIEERPLSVQTMPAGIRLELSTDGFDDKNLAFTQRDDADERATDTAPEAEGDDAENLLPQVLLLSSGETTPFVLRLLPPEGAQAWVIETDGLRRARATAAADEAS
ncbi:MAG: type II secretion system minor pseudopilin GspH [Pseudomonadales bacterium]